MKNADINLATKNALQIMAAKARRLEAALQQISEGKVMTGEFTHLDVILKYQDIASKALSGFN